MLKQRIITGVALALITILGVMLLPSAAIAIVFAVVFGLAAWEWSLLTSQRSPMLRGLYVLMVLLAFAIVWVLKFTVLSKMLLLLALFLWASICFVLFQYRSDPNRPPRQQLPLALLGPFILSAAFIATYALHQSSPLWLLYAFALTALADVGAYFAGKKFGKNKLSPHLSPGKTREGWIGGMLVAVVFALIVSPLLSLTLMQSMLLIFLSVIMSSVSVVGDLFFSMLKRESGVKDSGNILPGHGGVLDRLDSHIAVLPLFYIGLSWIL